MSFESAFINATVAPDTTVVNSTMDWIMSKMDQFPLKLSFFFACTMVIGSVVPYIPQYFTIKQTQNTEGFSLYVCLTLLVANILRIMFWFGKHFETALLIQSIVMILAMFGLLELCVRVRNSNLIIQGRRHYFAGGESDPKKTNGNGDVTVVTAAVDSVVIGNIDSKSALVNGDLKNDDLSKAVTRSTVSSTILNQLVIPNPNSILNQLTSSSSSPSSPPTSSLNDQTETMNVSVNNNESRSQCNTAPIATSNSSDSVGSTGRRCIVIAQQRQSSISSQSSSQPTSPKDLCAANLPAQISSSNASSVSECTSIISKPQFIPKQNEQSKHESSAESSDCSQPNNNVDDHSDLDGANGDDGASKDLLIEMNHDEDDDDDGEQTGTKYSIQMGDDNRPNDDGSSPTEKLMVAVLTSSSKADTLPTRRHFLDFDLRYFWEWTDFISYLECMAIFAFFTGLLMYFFINQPLVVEGYGLVALVTESLLASPQFVRNFKAKSTEGMSRMMVFTWFLGDLYKTVYFVVRSAPFQFILCGFTQITFDVLIFIQVLIYKKASYAKLAKARTLRHLEERARKRFKANLRTKKMIELLNSVPLDSDDQHSRIRSHGDDIMVSNNAHTNDINLLDDTIMVDSSIPTYQYPQTVEGDKRDTCVELVPIVSSRSITNGGYVNEAILDDSNEQDLVARRDHRIIGDFDHFEPKHSIN